jgi:hypothetical protein
MDNATRLLVLAAEDFTGLWDMALEFSGSDRDGRELASEALTQLVIDGLVEIYIGGPLFSSNPDPVAPDLLDVLLTPGPQWAVPEPGADGPFVYVAATDAGRNHLTAINWGQNQ